MTQRVAARTALLAVAAVWLVSLVLWITPGIVRPDGAGYVVYLPSTWLDHDLLFFNEWQRLGMVQDGVILHKEVTRTAHLSNHWTVGSAMAWYPAFLLGDAIRLFTPFRRDGFSLPYNLPIILTSAVAGLLTLIAGMRIARTLASPSASMIAAIGTWLGTPLLWYSLVHATMAHAISSLACALVVAASLAVRERRDDALVLLAGLASGFALVVRPQNAPFAILPLLVANLRTRRELALYTSGGALAALPELIASTFLYGSPFGFLTGGGTTSFSLFQRIWTWEPLLSWYHGLFTWAPFAAIGIVGVLLLLRRDRRLATALLFAFVAEWAINATMERSFWGAFSFGPRRFDNCAIVFLVGAAVVIDRWRAIGTLLVAAASLWTLSLFLAARHSLDLAAYYTPSELVRAMNSAWRDAGALFEPLRTTPAPLRGTVVIIALAFAALAFAVAVLVRAMSLRARTALACAWLIAISLLFTWCGLRDRARTAPYAELIARNRALAAIPGGAHVRFGLLEDEIRYLRKSGRDAEAARTEKELEELRTRRDAAIDALREKR